MRYSRNADVRKVATHVAVINDNARPPAHDRPSLNIFPALQNRSSDFVKWPRSVALALCSVGILFAAWSEVARAQETSAPLLTAAIIRGADTYSSIELLSTYQAYLGQPITNPVVEAIAAALNAKYATDGYSPSELQLDTSQLALGVLGIQVFESRITQVKVSGDTGPYAKHIDKLRAELIAMRPLKTNKLQTSLRRVRELPGLRVDIGTDRDSAVRNAFIVTLDASFDAWSTNLRITNRGTRDVGPAFFIGQTSANGLFGLDLKAGAVLGLAETPREFRGGGVFIDTPVFASDRRANLLAFRSLSDPTEKAGDAGVDYIHNRISWIVSNPWRRWGAFEVKSSGGLELDDQYIKLRGTEVQADRERVVSANTQALWSPSLSMQYLASWGLRIGVDAAGAGLGSLLAVEPGRDEDFVVGTLQIVQLTRFAAVWQVRFDLLGQYSNDVLADRERFKIGGDHLGRGFEVPAISGDRGLGAKAELRRGLPILNSAAGEVATYAYYDFGAAWRNPRGDRESAASAGVGVSLQGERITASLEFARPLTRADIDGFKHNTLFGELSVNF